MMNVNPHKLGLLSLCVRMSSKRENPQWPSTYDYFVSYVPENIVKRSEGDCGCVY